MKNDDSFVVYHTLEDADYSMTSTVLFLVSSFYPFDVFPVVEALGFE